MLEKRFRRVCHDGMHSPAADGGGSSLPPAGQDRRTGQGSEPGRRGSEDDAFRGSDAVIIISQQSIG